jgi:hypothetical protein
LDYGLKLLTNQYAWLEKDLKVWKMLRDKLLTRYVTLQSGWLFFIFEFCK